ncbi:MAG TPA: hypothetical protein VNN18_08830 [Candidatus Xenobia bacterium]|nr:hypothetical protein [Candidatus Xenobia bacterium]
MKTDWMTREQFDWWLDNVAAPDAPLRWFARFQMAGPAAWAVAVVKYLGLVVWASAFIWVWFTLFTLLFLYEGLGLAPWARSSGPPPAPAKHG